MFVARLWLVDVLGEPVEKSDKHQLSSWEYDILDLSLLAVNR